MLTGVPNAQFAAPQANGSAPQYATGYGSNGSADTPQGGERRVPPSSNGHLSNYGGTPTPASGSGAVGGMSGRKQSRESPT